MSGSQIMNNKIMITLKEISAHKNIIQKARELNFDKEVQYEKKNELKARKDEEFEHIIRKNRYFGRSDGGRVKKKNR